MKLLFFLILLFCLNPFPGKAQGFRAGLVGGIVGTQVDGDQKDGYHKAGAVFGGLSNFSWSNRWSSQFDIIYIQKGSRSKFDSTNTIPFYRLQLHYIEVPLLMQYHFRINKLVFMGEGGLSFAKLLGYKEEESYISYTNGNFLPYDYCFNLGIAHALGKKLYLHLRYEYSILPIRHSPKDPYILFGPGQYNNVLGFTLRYYFKEFPAF